jgi:hypothetical protein
VGPVSRDREADERTLLGGDHPRFGGARRGAAGRRLPFIHETYAQLRLSRISSTDAKFHVFGLGNDSLFVLPAAEMDFSFFNDVRTVCARTIPSSFPAPAL